jgi:hypothetical protein
MPNRANEFLLVILVVALTLEIGCSTTHHGLNGAFTCTHEELDRSWLLLKSSIQNEDVDTLLSLFSDENASELLPDWYFSKGELEEGLRNKEGPYYARLFDTECYRRLYINIFGDVYAVYGVDHRTGQRYDPNLIKTIEDLKSVRELFAEADASGRSVMRVIPCLGEYSDIKQRYEVGYILAIEYDWPGRSQAFYGDPWFKCTKDGWKVVKLFGDQ